MRSSSLLFLALGMALPLLTDCAQRLPEGKNFVQLGLQTNDISYSVDEDLLTSSHLPEVRRLDAATLLLEFRQHEAILVEYHRALLDNLSHNESLMERYDVLNAVVGAIAGLTSIGVLFATVAVAVPIAATVAIGVTLGIQNFSIKPEETTAQRRIDEADHLIETLPDIERSFDAMVFADSEREAVRRHERWKTYATEFVRKVDGYFARYAARRP